MTQVSELENVLTRTLVALGEASQTSPEQGVEVGTILWNAQAQAQELLNPIKAIIRERASREDVKKGGHIYLNGSNKGLCQVIVPKTQTQLKKSADVDRLEEVLGKDFEHIFKVRETVTLRKKAMGRIAKLPPELKVELLHAIEDVEPTPRVVFTEKKLWNQNQ